MSQNPWNPVSLATIVILLLSLACDRRAQQSVTTRPEVAQDQKALEQLREAGSDLAKTHSVHFYLYVPSQQDANATATALQRDNFNTVVKSGADGKRWLCLGQKSMIPTIENLTEARQIFSTLATQYGGEYDGWKAEVQP
jgi:hypothetical protein